MAKARSLLRLAGLLVISMLCIVHAEENSESELPADIAEFTHAIHRRYYCIARLKRTMGMIHELEKINRFSLCRPFLMLLVDRIKSKHPRVQQCVEDIKCQGALQPLCSLWNHIVSYKSIGDNLLEDDTIYLVFFIVRNLSSNLRSGDNELRAFEMPDSTIHVADVGTKEVAVRLYMMRRLEKAFASLSSYKECTVPLLRTYFSGEQGIVLKDCTIPLTHPGTKSCVKGLLKECRVDALLSLWDEMQQFRYIGDIRFLREFLWLVTTVYHSISTLEGLRQERKLSACIKDLSIEELLEGIDEDAQKSYSLSKNEKEKKGHGLWLTIPCIALVVMMSHYYISGGIFK